MSNIKISSVKSAYRMKAPRRLLASICWGELWSATPQFSEKALLEFASRDVGVILT
jgi:hypothetical protein